MALTYIYKKYKDVYTIENTGLVPLTYTVTRKECDSSTVIKTGTIAVNIIVTLPINFVDGTYVVTISDGILTDTLPDILFYNNLLLTIISNVEKVLCGCKPCNDCEDCNSCDEYLNTVSEVLAFAYINHPKYNSYIEDIITSIKCDFTEHVLCMLTKKSITGDEDTKNIYLRIIGLHYLAFYLVDLAGAFDTEEADYIKLKYNSSRILKCLKKVGIDIDETSEIFLEDIQVYYWQLNNVGDDIDDVIPLFNSTYLNDKPVVNLEVFEQGNIVNYVSVGRIAFAIKETDILNFTVVDALNNDITDEFDNEYFPLTKTVLFVSKNPYSFSSVYFKFKPITNL